MILFKRSADLVRWLGNQRSSGKTTAFVPTMGALHEGHIHLMETGRSFADLSICSIFVNPSQFNDPKDFEKYPVSLEKDIELLLKAGTDLLFLPSVGEIYPNGLSGLESYQLGNLDAILEGRYRPGHFQGVCQVMSRLLHIAQPNHLLMGQKDFQQCLIVKKLLEIEHSPILFHTIPTVRESDGLAQSSRNRRLKPDQRKTAAVLSRALGLVKDKIKPGIVEPVLLQARKMLNLAGFKTDYLEIAGTADLHPIQNWNGQDKAVALVAAFLGEVRLIDNMLLN